MAILRVADTLSQVIGPIVRAQEKQRLLGYLFSFLKFAYVFVSMQH